MGIATPAFPLRASLSSRVLVARELQFARRKRKCNKYRPRETKKNAENQLN
ncbi:hypothetical protein HMPREF0044_0628 [Gleimia coleocanis DSM 15436]|uniref:Uncharacterized protein n=1 Tax=Gleimia coleocanis DSM 15436 TaxID=525245 RepID=C0VZN8_9ACTO|nr:hypothetical protein HMPREF0044_0628 [Gleimia coleocanis DSM 15436]